MASNIFEIPGKIPEIPFSTTNITLAYLVKLSAGELDKLKTIYEAGLASTLVAKQFSTMISVYALGTTLIAGVLAYLTPDSYENVKRVFLVISVAAGITAGLSGFANLVQTIQIADYRYWRNVCITFMNP